MLSLNCNPPMIMLACNSLPWNLAIVLFVCSVNSAVLSQHCTINSVMSHHHVAIVILCQCFTINVLTQIKGKLLKSQAIQALL